jgi:porphobilinogen synthase
MRRLRRTEGLRRLAREVTLSPDDFILPLFAVPGQDRREDVPSMPGVANLSLDHLRRHAAELSVGAVLLFGSPEPEEKDETGSAAASEGAVVSETVRALKEERPDLVVITDVCLCAYTSHGHCGILTERGEVGNDATLKMVARMATAHAAAGADVVAPSGMMDGQVSVIREALDQAGLRGTAIMAYAAKFASVFYGPFRDVAHSAPSFGDRRAYQLPPANRREALKDAVLDEQEGADWLMVKPAMPYLDVLRELRVASRAPLAAYQVSGEYAMLKRAAEAGAFDERDAVLEACLCIKRAGADAIVTYYADQIVGWLAAG